MPEKKILCYEEENNGGTERPGTGRTAARTEAGTPADCQPDAGDGTAEGGGRAADHDGRETGEIWADVKNETAVLQDYISSWQQAEPEKPDLDQLKRAYGHAISVAAALEKHINGLESHE